MKTARLILGSLVNIFFIIGAVTLFKIANADVENFVTGVALFVLMFIFVFSMFKPTSFFGVVIVILGIFGLIISSNKILYGLIILFFFSAFGLIVIKSASIARKLKTDKKSKE
ncbi:MAG: hypothetical protein JXR68_01295 [Bacteroidales bacterium]|nr:hypothetical protein [Bacteroidales bacterium]